MKKTTKELNGKSIKELEKMVQTLREDIAKVKLNAKVNPSKDTNVLPKKRKQLAVILTLLTEKKTVEQIQSKNK